MEEELSKCRLCNYQSDKRLMLDVFDQNTDYCGKIEDYLSIKIHESSPPIVICFHCSQTLDNFHNFATKIKAIQKILFPIPEPAHEEQTHQQQQQKQESSTIHEQIFEIQVINESQDSFEDLVKAPQKTFKVHRKEQNEEVTFDLLSTFEENEEQEEQFEVISAVSGDETANEEEFKLFRDPEDEDFPSAEALKRIPTKLIENGSLIYKGSKLMRLMSIFYNTSCKICQHPRRFSTVQRLFEHYKNSHADTEPFVMCCSMALKRMPKIIWHFVKHIEPDAFKCDRCDYAVSRPKFLAIHRQTHLPDSEKPLECDMCEKRFIWKGALKNHLLNHRTDKKLFACGICGRSYQTAGSLATHRKSAHVNTDKTRKLCEICSKSFSTLTSYKEHLTLHSEDRDKMQLRCKECGKWLKNKRCLKSHLLLHTSEERKCELCEYVTKKEKLLRNHMVTKHSEDKTFVCEENGCGKSFKVKRALTIHKAKEHGGKSAARKCEFCSREFANSTNYYTHRKNLHAKELAEVNARKKEEEKMRRVKAGLEGLA